MLGSPPDIDIAKVLERIRMVAGITDVHHIHLWQMQENENALDAHITIVQDNWANAEAIKEIVKSMLRDDFSISHTTLEIECSTHACNDAVTIGHWEVYLSF